MTEQERDDWLIVASLKTLGPRRFSQLADSCGNDIHAIAHAPHELLARVFGTRIATRICTERAQCQSEQLALTLEAHNIQIVTCHADNYPFQLRQTFDPPPVLFYRGTLPTRLDRLVSIVGTRKPTPYGHRAIEHLFHDLAGTDLVVVSGLAFGIDALAHNAALTAGLRTIAILPSGIDASSIAPRSHLRLANTILQQGGCLLSEYPPGTPPYPSHYPVRNRLIAGISQVTVVVQGALKSGSAITAEAALRENRDVLTVPGPIDSPASALPHRLLQEGALPLTRGKDLLTHLGITAQHDIHRAPLHLSPREETLLTHLSQDGTSAEELGQHLARPVTEILGLLTQLELKGAVRHIGSGFYRRT